MDWRGGGGLFAIADNLHGHEAGHDGLEHVLDVAAARGGHHLVQAHHGGERVVALLSLRLLLLVLASLHKQLIC